MKNRGIKFCAIFVLLTFITTSIDPVAFANPSPTGEVSLFPAKILNIPAEFGQVTDTVMGDPEAPALIHIQSAHANYSAEKNIEQLLGYLEKNSSVRLMLLEGAADKLQPERFRIFPDHPDFNRKVTDKLVREGYLTGPERFLIENADYRPQTTDKSSKTDFSLQSLVSGLKSDTEAFQAFGVEDLNAYKKDRAAFIKVIHQERTAEKYIASLRASIDKRFSTKISKDLLSLVRQEEAYGSGTVSFEGWLKLLGDASKKHLKTDLEDAFYQDRYPHLIRYYRLQAIGSKIDQEKAQTEKEAFLKELENRKLSEDVISLFQDEGGRMVDGDKLKTSSIRLPPSALRSASGYSPLRHAFDAAFSKLPRDFSMTAWPAWTLYAQYTILTQELEAKGLHDEVEKLKNGIFQSLAQTPEEKEYLAEARNLYLLKRLFSLELTRSEYEELKIKMTEGGGRKAEGAGGSSPSAILHPPSSLFASAMSFYTTALIRENKMFENTLAKMGETKQKRAVIITGGFHTEGLKQLAASKECSYIQITPRIAEVTKRDREIYLRSILGTQDKGKRRADGDKLPAPSSILPPPSSAQSAATAQMNRLSALMGINSFADVIGMAEAEAFSEDVLKTIDDAISQEPVEIQPPLRRAVSNSVFTSPASSSKRSETRLSPEWQKTVADLRAAADHYKADEDLSGDVAMFLDVAKRLEQEGAPADEQSFHDMFSGNNVQGAYALFHKFLIHKDDPAASLTRSETRLTSLDRKPAQRTGRFKLGRIFLIAGIAVAVVAIIYTKRQDQGTEVVLPGNPPIVLNVDARFTATEKNAGPGILCPRDWAASSKKIYVGDYNKVLRHEGISIQIKKPSDLSEITLLVDNKSGKAIKVNRYEILGYDKLKNIVVNFSEEPFQAFKARTTSELRLYYGFGPLSGLVGTMTGVPEGVIVRVVREDRKNVVFIFVGLTQFFEEGIKNLENTPAASGARSEVRKSDEELIAALDAIVNAPNGWIVHARALRDTLLSRPNDTFRKEAQDLIDLFNAGSSTSRSEIRSNVLPKLIMGLPIMTVLPAQSQTTDGEGIIGLLITIGFFGGIMILAHIIDPLQRFFAAQRSRRHFRARKELLSMNPEMLLSELLKILKTRKGAISVPEAIERLGEMGGERAFEPLVRELEQGNKEAIRAIEKFQLSPEATERLTTALLRILETNNPRAIPIAAELYEKVKLSLEIREKLVLGLIKILENRTGAIAETIMLLGRIKDERAFELLVRELEREYGFHQQAAVAIEGFVLSPAMRETLVAALLKILETGKGQVDTAIELAGRIKDERTFGPLARGLERESRYATKVAEAIKNFGLSPAMRETLVAALLKILEMGKKSVDEVIELSVQIRDEKTLESLARDLENKNERAIDPAHDYLGQKLGLQLNKLVRDLADRSKVEAAAQMLLGINDPRLAELERYLKHVRNAAFTGATYNLLTNDAIAVIQSSLKQGRAIRATYMETQDSSGFNILGNTEEEILDKGTPTGEKQTVPIYGNLWSSIPASLTVNINEPIPLPLLLKEKLAAFKKQSSTNTRSEVRLTKQQEAELKRVEKNFGPVTASYVKMAILFFSNPAKLGPEEKDSRYVAEKYAEDWQRWQTEFAAIEGNAALKALAQNAVVRVLSLDGGLGEKLGRQEWKAWLVKEGLLSEEAVERDTNGIIKLGAKGTDMGVLVKANDGTIYYVSASEAKLLQLYRKGLNHEFSALNFRPIVNGASKGSYEALLSEPNLVDIMKGIAKPRTYRELLASAGVNVDDFLFQPKVPGLREEADGTLMPASEGEYTQEGGHGQIGHMIVGAPETYQPRQDGKPDIVAFTNGDNMVSSDIVPEIVGDMIQHKRMIGNLVTPATRVDRKGGKYIVKWLEFMGLTKWVPGQREEAAAKGLGREALENFYKAGQPEGESIFGAKSSGKQPFNTNNFYIDMARVMPFLADLKKVMGEEGYLLQVISPNFMKKDPKDGTDGRKYYPIDSAIGNVFHNINEFVMQMTLIAEAAKDGRVALTKDQKAVLDVFAKHGVTEVIHYYNVPRKKFTPQKNPFDALMQLTGKYYRMSLTETDLGALQESGTSLVPPEVTIKDAAGNLQESGKGHYSEFFNMLGTFVTTESPETILNSSFDLTRLDRLEIDGNIAVRDAIWAGDVTIINQDKSGQVFDLGAAILANDTLKKQLSYKEGRPLWLGNVRITVSADYQVTVETSFTRSEVRKELEGPKQTSEGPAFKLKLKIDQLNRNILWKEFAQGIVRGLPALSALAFGLFCLDAALIFFFGFSPVFSGKTLPMTLTAYGSLFGFFIFTRLNDMLKQKIEGMESILALLQQQLEKSEAASGEVKSRSASGTDAPKARSEVRLPDAQEKRLRKAMSDLQSKWWDGWFNGNGMDRRVAALKTLVTLRFSQLAQLERYFEWIESGSGKYNELSEEDVRFIVEQLSYGAAIEASYSEIGERNERMPFEEQTSGYAMHGGSYIEDTVVSYRDVHYPAEMTVTIIKTALSKGNPRSEVRSPMALALSQAAAEQWLLQNGLEGRVLSFDEVRSSMARTGIATPYLPEVDHDHGFFLEVEVEDAMRRQARRTAATIETLGSAALRSKGYQVRTETFYAPFVEDGEPTAPAVYSEPLNRLIVEIRPSDPLKPFQTDPVTLEDLSFLEDLKGIADYPAAREAHRDRLQKALADLQPKWWDSRFNENGTARKQNALEELGQLADFRAAPALIGFLSDERFADAATAALKQINDPLAHAALANHANKTRLSPAMEKMNARAADLHAQLSKNDISLNRWTALKRGLNLIALTSGTVAFVSLVSGALGIFMGAVLFAINFALLSAWTSFAIAPRQKKSRDLEQDIRNLDQPTAESVTEKDASRSEVRLDPLWQQTVSDLKKAARFFLSEYPQVSEVLTDVADMIGINGAPRNDDAFKQMFASPDAPDAFYLYGLYLEFTEQARAGASKRSEVRDTLASKGVDAMREAAALFTKIGLLKNTAAAGEIPGQKWTSEQIKALQWNDILAIPENRVLALTLEQIFADMTAGQRQWLDKRVTGLLSSSRSEVRDVQATLRGSKLKLSVGKKSVTADILTGAVEPVRKFLKGIFIKTSPGKGTNEQEFLIHAGKEKIPVSLSPANRDMADELRNTVFLALNAARSEAREGELESLNSQWFPHRRGYVASPYFQKTEVTDEAILKLADLIKTYDLLITLFDDRTGLSSSGILTGVNSARGLTLQKIADQGPQASPAIQQVPLSEVTHFKVERALLRRSETRKTVEIPLGESQRFGEMTIKPSRELMRGGTELPVSFLGKNVKNGEWTLWLPLGVKKAVQVPGTALWVRIVGVKNGTAKLEIETRPVSDANAPETQIGTWEMVAVPFGQSHTFHSVTLRPFNSPIHHEGGSIQLPVTFSGHNVRDGRHLIWLRVGANKAIWVPDTNVWVRIVNLEEGKSVGFDLEARSGSTPVVSHVRSETRIEDAAVTPLPDEQLLEREKNLVSSSIKDLLAYLANAHVTISQIEAVPGTYATYLVTQNAFKTGPKAFRSTIDFPKNGGLLLAVGAVTKYFVNDPEVSSVARLIDAKMAATPGTKKTRSEVREAIDMSLAGVGSELANLSPLSTEDKGLLVFMVSLFVLFGVLSFGADLAGMVRNVVVKRVYWRSSPWKLKFSDLPAYLKSLDAPIVFEGADRSGSFNVYSVASTPKRNLTLRIEGDWNKDEIRIQYWGPSDGKGVIPEVSHEVVYRLGDDMEAFRNVLGLLVLVSSRSEARETVEIPLSEDTTKNSLTFRGVTIRVGETFGGRPGPNGISNLLVSFSGPKVPAGSAARLVKGVAYRVPEANVWVTLIEGTAFQSAKFEFETRPASGTDVPKARSEVRSSITQERHIQQALRDLRRTWIEYLFPKEGAERRVAAAKKLGRWDGPQAVAALMAALKDPQPEVRLAILGALGRIADPEIVPALSRLAKDNDLSVRSALAKTLGNTGASQAAPMLIDLLRKDPVPHVRVQAAWGLLRIDDPRVNPALDEAIAKDKNYYVRKAAEHTLSSRIGFSTPEKADGKGPSETRPVSGTDAPKARSEVRSPTSQIEKDMKGPRRFPSGVKNALSLVSLAAGIVIPSVLGVPVLGSLFIGVITWMSAMAAIEGLERHWKNRYDERILTYDNPDHLAYLEELIKGIPPTVPGKTGLREIFRTIFKAAAPVPNPKWLRVQEAIKTLERIESERSGEIPSPIANAIPALLSLLNNEELKDDAARLLAKMKDPRLASLQRYFEWIVEAELFKNKTYNTLTAAEIALIQSDLKRGATTKVTYRQSEEQSHNALNFQKGYSYRAVTKPAHLTVTIVRPDISRSVSGTNAPKARSEARETKKTISESSASKKDTLASGLEMGLVRRIWERFVDKLDYWPRENALRESEFGEELGVASIGLSVLWIFFVAPFFSEERWIAIGPAVIFFLAGIIRGVIFAYNSLRDIFDALKFAIQRRDVPISEEPTRRVSKLIAASERAADEEREAEERAAFEAKFAELKTKGDQGIILLINALTGTHSERAARLLSEINDPRLASLKRYFDYWGTKNNLTKNDIAIIRSNFEQGLATTVTYDEYTERSYEIPAEPIEEKVYDNEGTWWGETKITGYTQPRWVTTTGEARLFAHIVPAASVAPVETPAIQTATGETKGETGDGSEFGADTPEARSETRAPKFIQDVANDTKVAKAAVAYLEAYAPERELALAKDISAADNAAWNKASYALGTARRNLAQAIFDHLGTDGLYRFFWRSNRAASIRQTETSLVARLFNDDAEWQDWSSVTLDDQEALRLAIAIWPAPSSPRSEVRNGIVKKWAVLWSALTLLPATLQASPWSVVMDFARENPFWAWTLGIGGAMGALVGLYFAAWRIFAPISWFIWRLDSYDWDVPAYSKKKLAAKGAQAVPALLKALNKKNGPVTEVIDVLGEIKDDRAFEPLALKLKEDVSGAARAVGQYPLTKSLPHLIQALGSSEYYAPKQAVEVLQKLKNNKVVTALNGMLSASAERPFLIRAVEVLLSYKDPTSVAPLNELLLQSQDPAVVASVARALGEFTDPSSVDPLVERAFSRSLDSSTRNTILGVLTSYKSPKAQKALLVALGNLEEDVRNYVTQQFISRRDASVVESLNQVLRTRRNVNARLNAIKIIHHYKDPRSADVLIDTFRDPDQQVRVSVLRDFGPWVTQLEESQKTRAVNALEALAQGDPIEEIRGLAVDYLGRFGDSRVVDTLIAILRNIGSPTPLRVKAAAALATIMDERAVQPLIETLTDPEILVQISAAKALEPFKAFEAVEPLSTALSSVLQLNADTSLYAERVRFQAAVLRTLANIGARATLALLSFLNTSDDEALYVIANALRKINDPLLMNLERYFRWLTSNISYHAYSNYSYSLGRYVGPGYLENGRTFNALSKEEVAILRDNYLKGIVTEATYIETPEETTEVDDYDAYGSTYGSHTEILRHADLKVTVVPLKSEAVTESKNTAQVMVPEATTVEAEKTEAAITGAETEPVVEEASVPSLSQATEIKDEVVLTPATSPKTEAKRVVRELPEPFIPDVKFWDLETPEFDPSHDGMNLIPIREVLASMSLRNWLWRFFSGKDRIGFRQQVVERIGAVRNRIAAVMIMLSENQIISKANPVVSISLVGSYPWVKAPNDLDLVVVVEGERPFERISPEQLAAGTRPVVLGLATSIEVVGLDTLKRAAKGEDFEWARILRRKLISYSGSIPLTGLDLFKGQKIPFENYAVMREDLTINAGRANWPEVRGDEEKIAAKREWRKTEIEALAQWLEERSEEILTGVNVSVSEELLRKEESYRNEMPRLIQEKDAAYQEEVARLVKEKQKAHQAEVDRLIKEKTAAHEEDVNRLKQEKEAARQAEVALLVQEQNVAYRDEIFGLVLSRVPAYLTKLRTAMEELKSLVNQPVLTPEEVAAAIAAKEQKYALSEEGVRILRSIFETPETPMTRSETRQAEDKAEKQASLREIAEAVNNTDMKTGEDLFFTDAQAREASKEAAPPAKDAATQTKTGTERSEIRMDAAEALLPEPETVSLSSLLGTEASIRGLLETARQVTGNIVAVAVVKLKAYAAMAHDFFREHFRQTPALPAEVRKALPVFSELSTNSAKATDKRFITGQLSALPKDDELDRLLPLVIFAEQNREAVEVNLVITGAPAEGALDLRTQLETLYKKALPANLKIEGFTDTQAFMGTYDALWNKSLGEKAMAFVTDGVDATVRKVGGRNGKLLRVTANPELIDLTAAMIGSAVKLLDDEFVRSHKGFTPMAELGIQALVAELAAYMMAEKARATAA